MAERRAAAAGRQGQQRAYHNVDGFGEGHRGGGGAGKGGTGSGGGEKEEGKGKGKDKGKGKGVIDDVGGVVNELGALLDDNFAMILFGLVYVGLIFVFLWACLMLYTTGSVCVWKRPPFRCVLFRKSRDWSLVLLLLMVVVPFAPSFLAALRKGLEERRQSRQMVVMAALRRGAREGGAWWGKVLRLQYRLIGEPLGRQGRPPV